MAKTFDINLLSTTIRTFDADGVDITGVLSSNSLNRMAESKRFTFKFTLDSPAYGLPDKTLEGLSVYISPALFAKKGLLPSFNGFKPSEYWVYTFDNAATPGTNDMIQVVNGAYADGLTKNYTVQISNSNNYEFTVLIYCYMIYDLGTFMQSSLEQNRYKLLKDRANNASILTVSGQSVYNNTSYVPEIYVYIEDPNNTIDYSFVVAGINDFKAGFYGKNEDETAPYFTNPLFVLSSPNSSGIISLSENTTVDFFIDSATAVTKIIYWLIRTDTNDDTVDFIDNYEASIINSGGSADNKIITPITSISGAGTYTSAFTIDKTQVAFGQTYRIIAVVYDGSSGSPRNVNSFISDEYSLTNLPQFIGSGYDFTGSITDYMKEYTGNDLICVIEERLRSRLEIDYTYNVFQDDMFNRLGLSVDNDIRRYLTKIVVEVYEDQDANTRHYFTRLNANKIDPINYNVDAGLSLNFQNGILDILYDFRVRYESAVTNIETTYNGVPLSTPTANQNWAGRNLRIRYKLELYYDNYSTPFSDTLIFIQKLHPKNYSSSIQLAEEDGSPLTGEQYYCLANKDCFKAELLLPYGDTSEYKLITTIEKSPGNINFIEENEVFEGALDKETSDKFYSQEENFGETTEDEAKFCLDNSKFLINQKYKLSAIAKKDKGVCTTASGFLTLDGAQDQDKVYVGDRQYIYFSDLGGWTNGDSENYAALIDSINNDSLKANVSIVENVIGVHTLTFTYNICGSIGNITANNSPKRTNFHWDPNTEVDDKLTGGAG